MGWGGLVPTSTRTPTRDSRITTPSASADQTLPPGSPATIPLATGSGRTVELRNVHIGSIAYLVAVADGDEGQIAIQIAIVQAVAEHETVVELHAAITHRLGHDATRRPVEQRAHIEPTRAARRELGR